MQVKWGALIAEARGAMGGIVASRNRAGAFLRNRTKPVDPGSAKQNIQRSNMTNGVAQWRDLSAAARDLWNAKALVTSFTNRIGESFHPTGMNIFMKSAQLLLAGQLTAITTPPVLPVVDDTGITCTYTLDPGLEMNAEQAALPIGSSVLVWYQYNMTNSTYYYKGPYANTAILNPANFITGAFTILADAGIEEDSSMAVAWRVIQADGGSSAIRRVRLYKPPGA